MAIIFSTLADLLEAALGSHDGKLGEILSAVHRVAEKQNVLEGQITCLKTAQETMQADLLSIKVFLGVPDARIVATQADLDVLGARIHDQTADIQQFDAGVTEPPPQS